MVKLEATPAEGGVVKLEATPAEGGVVKLEATSAEGGVVKDEDMPSPVARAVGAVAVSLRPRSGAGADVL